MGWRRCDGCGRTISDRAPSCPFCAVSSGLATPGALAAAAVPAASAPTIAPIAPAFPIASAPVAMVQPIVGGGSKFWEPSTPDGVAKPTRLAGWMLILGGIAGALAPVASFARGGAVVDVVIGAALALNYSKWRFWALVRVVIGTIVWPIVALTQHDIVSLVVQLLYSVSLLVLLQERPRRAFVPWAIGVAAIVLVLTYLGLAMMFLQPQQQAAPRRVNTPRRSF